MGKMKFLFAAMAFIALTTSSAKADFNEDGLLEVSSDFKLFTSDNFKGYTKPLFTTIGQGIQSNLYTVATFNQSYSIGIDLSLASTIIPGSQQVYDAKLPAAFGDITRMDNAIYKNGKVIRNIGGTVEQPTIYGGASNAIYVVAPVEGGDPADSIYKTIAFNEGNDISTMAALPSLQLIFGLPTRTELRFRYVGAPINDQSYSYLSISASQQVDKWFDMFDEIDDMGLALNVSYQFMTLAKTLDMNSWAVGMHFSKGFGDGWSAYTGLQIEDLSGRFNMVRQNGYKAEYYEPNGEDLKAFNTVPVAKQADFIAHVQARDEVKDNPYEEVRLLKPLSFDIETFTNWRVLIGGAYEYGIFEIHLDLGYASQMFVNGGVRFRFKEWKNEVLVAE